MAFSTAISAAEEPASQRPSWRGVNPDMLSGGLYFALEAAGELGARTTPARANAVYPNLAKGRPAAVLDPRIGANLRLGDDPDALPGTQRGQAEPHIVRSPVNSEVLLATFQEGRFFNGGGISCGYSVSHDGGFTWTRALIPQLTTANGGRFNRATDPVAGAGPQGDLYLQTLGSVLGAFQVAAVVVSRSSDGGANWSAPAVVFEATSPLISPDKNWLAVNDFPGLSTSGRLVSTWTNFFRTANGQVTGSPIMSSVSNDRGATWSPPINVTPLASRQQGSQPVFLPDGSLLVVYITFLNPADVSQFNIVCKRSADGGVTYPDSEHTVVGFINGWNDPVVREGIFLPSVTVARQTGDIFVTFVGIVNASPRVLVTKSTDQGTTWTAPVIASDQPPGVSVMNPAITVTPDGRTVSLVFMDKRDAADGRNFVDHYAAWSFDGGATWQPNVRLTDMSSDVRLAPDTMAGRMLGDYIGIAPSVGTEQPSVAVWCDTRTGDADPFVARFVASRSADLRSWTLARFSTTLRADARLEERDTDGDGIANRSEFALGTDPLTPESGEPLALRRTGNAIDVLWLERPEAGASAIEVRRDQPAGAVVPTTPVPAAELPASPTAGLTWKGRRVSAEATAPLFVRYGWTTVSGAGPRVLFAPGDSSPATANTDARLINLSTRGTVTSGAGNMIVGFVLEGNKTILVRAAGPALTALGVTGALSDPQLTLAAPASDLLRTNDNWEGGDLAALFARVGAFPFPSNSRDAALALAIGRQNYSAIVTGANNATGIALVEAYDADAVPGAPGNPRLLNLSTRGEAGVGDAALIAGFVIFGSQPRRVLLRAIGPTLVEFGLTGTLSDPVVMLFRGNTVIAANDDWEISRSSGAIAVTAARVGAFPLRGGTLDAALLLTLEPGAYTAIVTSADGGTGLALVEIYDAD